MSKKDDKVHVDAVLRGSREASAILEALKHKAKADGLCTGCLVTSASVNLLSLILLNELKDDGPRDMMKYAGTIIETALVLAVEKYELDKELKVKAKDKTAVADLLDKFNEMVSGRKKP